MEGMTDKPMKGLLVDTLSVKRLGLRLLASKIIEYVSK